MTAAVGEARALETRRAGFWWGALRRFRRHRPAWVAAWVLLALVLAAIFAEAIAPYSPYEQFLEPPSGGVLDPLEARETGKYEAPSLVHPLGTDELARDVLSRTLIGLRISMAAAAVAMVVATLLGTLVGVLAALGPRGADALLMRATDAAFAFPALLLIILLRAVFQGTALGRTEVLGVSTDLLLLFFAISLAAWPEMARLVRGQLLSIRELDHVMAAESLGCSPARIALRHMLPLTLPVMLVEATFLVPRAIAAEAALSFIGIGAAPPTPSLGVLASQHFGFVAVQWTALASTTATLVLIFLVFQLVGDGLAGALAPRRGQ
jgi:ABC-type dipeptide/oligopeptide/nickel transport system permease subunit